MRFKCKCDKLATKDQVFELFNRNLESFFYRPLKNQVCAIAFEDYDFLKRNICKSVKLAILTPHWFARQNSSFHTILMKFDELTVSSIFYRW